MSSSRAAAWIAFAAVAWARPAHADPYVAAGVTGTWLPALPSPTIEETKLESRAVAKGELPNRGGIVMLGAYADSGFVAGDRITIPLFGVAFHSAVGSYATVLTSRDGTLATLRPWTVYAADALLPGIGYRTKMRRWMVGASVRTGLTVVWETGSLVDGAAQKDVDGANLSFLLLGQIEACRRLDPEQRLCLEVAPRLYDFGWWNGGTIGLRYEIGR